MLKHLIVPLGFATICLCAFLPLAKAEQGGEIADPGRISEKYDTSFNVDSCSPCGKTISCRPKGGWEFEFDGWAESGILANSHGSSLNGPMHTKGNERTDFHLDQLYLQGAIKYTTRRGLQIGGQADLAYGVDATGMQSGGDETFDWEWGLNRHGYALAAYQLFGTVSYEKWNVKVGKFLTPIGWEGSASKDNFFYSHSYCYWIEPSTHCGVLADYALNDRLTLSAGWTTGNDTSFENPYDDVGFLAGLTCNLGDKATLYYWMTVGKTENGFRNGVWRFDDFGDTLRQDFFIQSLCLEWMPTERFTYVLQYNLRNDSDIEAGTLRTSAEYSSYGINNHFLYSLNDRWSVGMRLEWLRDNGGFGYVIEDPTDYFQVTLGVNWMPNKHFALRPEIRYDTAGGGSLPFGDGKRSDQFTGGVGMLVFF